jgi:hypothetical protein
MKTLTVLIAIPAAFAAVACVAQAGQVEKEKKPVEDPALVGEEVGEQSEFEKLLFTEYRKRRTQHFLLETSYDTAAAKDYIAFCEQSYRDFLTWAGKPADTDLWGSRARVVVVSNKAEWECLMTALNKGRPPSELEQVKKMSGQWNSSPPMTMIYSRDGSTAESDKLHLFHTLCHLFLHGLAGSSQQGIVWWLWEGFSAYRELEVFGAKGTSCVDFRTSAKKEQGGGWADTDKWIALLKKDAHDKQDEALELFWHKNVTDIQEKTIAKAWSLIRYLTRDEASKARFVEFLSMLKTRNDQARAMKEALGTDPNAIDAEWKKWIRLQLSKPAMKK